MARSATDGRPAGREADPVTAYRALVVGRDEEWSKRWARRLQRDGFLTFTCPGPSDALQCPRSSGERCIRREMVDVALVDEVDDEDRVCTRLRDDATTVYMRARADRTVGTHFPSSETPEGVLQAVWEAARGHRVP